MPFHLLPSARPDLPRSLPTGETAAFPAYGPLRACVVCFCDFLNAQTHDQGADGQGERAGGNMKSSTATGKAKKAPPKDVSPRPALPSICVCLSPSRSSSLPLCLSHPLSPPFSPLPLPPPLSPFSLSRSPFSVACARCHVRVNISTSLPSPSLCHSHTYSLMLSHTHPPTHSLILPIPSCVPVAINSTSFLICPKTRTLLLTGRSLKHRKMRTPVPWSLS